MRLSRRASMARHTSLRPKKLIIQPKTYMILEIYLCTRAPVRQRHQAIARVDELAEQIDRAFQLASLHRLETHVKHFLQPFRLHLCIHTAAIIKMSQSAFFVKNVLGKSASNYLKEFQKICCLYIKKKQDFYLTFDLMPLSKVFHFSVHAWQAQSNQYRALSAFCRSPKLFLE